MKHLLFITAITAAASMLTAACSSGADSGTDTADSIDVSALVDSLTTDSLDFDSLTPAQCGIRIAELEVQALLTTQYAGENSVAALRAVSTVNRAMVKVIERFDADSLAQEAFNQSYDLRYTQLLEQYPQVKSFTASISASATPAQLGAMGAEMEIMAQLAKAENGDDSEEYKAANADMLEFQNQIIELYRDNPQAQQEYITAYARHYEEMAARLAANAVAPPASAK